MKKFILLTLCLFNVAYADSIQLPNLSKSATGTSLGGGKYGLDISLPPGAVSINGSVPIGSVYNPGDNGLTSLSIRKDSSGPITGVADGDYTPLLVDSTGALKVSELVVGKSYTGSVRLNYVLSPVTTGAWVQLIASTSAAASEISVFDSSGQTMELGIGGSGSESRISLIFPGGQGTIPISIPAGSRISIRAVSGNASVGEIDLNLYN